MAGSSAADAFAEDVGEACPKRAKTDELTCELCGVGFKGPCRGLPSKHQNKQGPEGIVPFCSFLLSCFRILRPVG